MKIKNTPARTVLSLSALALLITGAVLYAGPLNPPAGPVTSTYKTLTEVEPRTAINAANTPGTATALFQITQPGSYYLTGNITGVAGKHGIEIAASGVTLDLNGFDLVGVPAMGAFDGVSATVSNLSNIAVVNGSVRNWGDEGVDLATLTVFSGHVANVLTSGNTGAGIQTGFGSTVANCSAYGNTFSGINAGSGSAVTNCAAYLNSVSGINTGNGSTVTKCAAYQNTGNGISTSGTGCTVADCSANGNTLDGIVCNFGSTIRGNTCSNNGNGSAGSGIHALNFDNRIEGNNCTGADRGIDVDTAGNIIIKNTCSGNTTNWDIAANNVCLVVQGVAGAAILGNTGGVAPGSTDPNANFTY